MQIKRWVIGEGKPLVCVPVVETEESRIYQEAEFVARQGAEALEWRMDWFAHAEQWEYVDRALRRLQEICGDIILLCTFRSKSQGGKRDISQDMYLGLLQRVAESGRADLLDVETPELSEPSAVIGMLRKAGQKVVSSSHYFSHTPKTEDMLQELGAMKQWGADIGKLAVMPHSPLDVLRLLEATAQIKEENPGYPLITMAMGGLGVISRISGQVFGSCMTFASVGKPSAPGQLPLADARGILDKISESME